MNLNKTKVLEKIQKYKSQLIVAFIFLLTTLPFFIIQLNFVIKNSTTVLYSDNIDLLVESLEGIKTNTFNFFGVHNGRFSPMTFMFVALWCNSPELTNGKILSITIPFIIYITTAIIWIFRLFKKQDISMKSVGFLLIYGLFSSILIFSFYNWEIVWLPIEIVVVLSNFLFVVTAALFQKFLKTEKYKIVFFITSLVIGLLTMLMFGNTVFSFAFAVPMIAVNIYYFVRHLRKDGINKWLFLISLSSYFILTIVLTILSNTGNRPDITVTFADFIKNYSYLHGILFVNKDYISSTDFAYHFAGISLLLVELFSIIIYLKNKYYKNNLFILFLLIFAELSFVSVSSFGKGVIVNTDKHYGTYVLLFMFVIDTLVNFIYEKTAYLSKKSGLGFVSALVANLYIFSLLFPHMYVLVKENKHPLLQREWTKNERVDLSLLYETYEDGFLASAYQTSSDNVKKCFELLNQYNLYTYSYNDQTHPAITDNFQFADFCYGLFPNEGNESRFMGKHAVFFLRSDADCDYELTLYNPVNFRSNTYSVYSNNEIIRENANINPGQGIVETLHFRKGINKVRIVLDHTICPADEGMSSDIRLLGLVIACRKA